MVIAVNSQEEWYALVRAMGDPPALISDKYSDHQSRQQYHDELDAIIQSWTLQHTHQEVMNILQSQGVPAGAVWNAEELVADPQLNDRGFFWEIDHPEVGIKRYSGFPIKMSGIPEWPKNPAPCLGEHNAEVLKNVLGLSDEEIQKLEADGVIGIDPID